MAEAGGGGGGGGGGEHAGKYIEPTFLMRPYEEKKFAPSVAHQISQEVCASMLEGKSWTGDGEEVVWTVQIAEQVKNRLKAINFARYKIVVQSVVGQQKQQGVRVASRCLWDTDTDNFSTYTYTNDTLWCTVMCFGLYSE